jgi:Xaa-Pro aminopeptidase
MKVPRVLALLLLVTATAAPSLKALEKQPTAVYHARRVALAAKLQGGVAVLFSAAEPELDFDTYRQDSNFYYLTGWNEPGAALLVVGQKNAYREILFLPTRNLRSEKYTGVKLDAVSPDVVKITGVDDVQPMTALPATLNKLIDTDRNLARNVWAQPGVKSVDALTEFIAATFAMGSFPPAHDVTVPIATLRLTKDTGEIDLLKKASAASIAGQRAMMKAVKPGTTERTVAGKMTAAWFEQGCERPAYAPIVGSGINSTILHYAENSRTIEDGDVVTVDAACEYSRYASDITRTVPANGHFTPRQREIYDVVLGAQKAAIDAFVAGKSKIDDRERKDPDSLDTAAYNYINTHGKDLHGDTLGKYWLHGLGHTVGLDVHDAFEVYPQVLKPGTVFTIEPGVYIPEEKIGVRIECVFLVAADGKLIDLTADLPHTADDVEAAMQGK